MRKGILLFLCFFNSTLSFTFTQDDMSDRPRMKIVQVVQGVVSSGINLVDSSLGKKQTNGGTTITMTFTKVPAAGNMVVCGVGSFGGGTWSSGTLTDDQSNTFLLDVFQLNGTGERASIWHFVVPSTASYSTYVLTYTFPSSAYATSSCIEVSGQNASPTDFTSQNAVAGVDAPIVTSPNGKSDPSSATTQLAMAVTAVNTGANPFTLTPDGSWTSIAKETNGSCCAVMDLSYKLSSTLSSTMIISTWTYGGGAATSMSALTSYKY